MPIPRHIIESLKKIIPPLDGSLHKGQSGMLRLTGIERFVVEEMEYTGRVGVLGGAKEYVR